MSDTNVSASDISQWCRDVIQGPGGLQNFERNEMATPLVDRDVAIAMWVVRCLGNSERPETQAVVDAIVSRRQGKP